MAPWLRLRPAAAPRVRPEYPKHHPTVMPLPTEARLLVEVQLAEGA